MRQGMNLCILLLAVSSLYSVVALEDSKDVVELDRGDRKGAGRRCPKTLGDYFFAFNDLLDEIVSGTRDSFEALEGLATLRGSGQVFGGKIDEDASTTFLWISNFQDLREQEVLFLQSLLVGDNFQFLLEDPTFKNGTTVEFLDTSEALGAASILKSTEAIFIPGLETFDREFVFVTSVEPFNESCTLRAFPSVSDEWIRSPRFLNDTKTFRTVRRSSSKIRGQNLYPGGDRLCVFPSSQNPNHFDAQFAHVVTAGINGVLGATGLFETGIVKSVASDAFFQETQTLEDKLFRSRTKNLRDFLSF